MFCYSCTAHGQKSGWSDRSHSELLVAGRWWSLVFFGPSMSFDKSVEDLNVEEEVSFLIACMH